MLFADDLRAGPPSTASTSQVTVDSGHARLARRVGLVTQLIDAGRFDAARTLALVCGPEVMMRYAAAALADRGVPRRGVRLSMERNMKCGVGLCGHCQLRELFLCVDGPVLGYDVLAPLHGQGGAVMTTGPAEHSGTPPPKLAVWKFASCDGCQLTLLNCEDELIPLAGEVEIAYFPEATRAVVEGPYDVSLVEGSITTPEELERIQQVREVSRRLITIGACATSRRHPGAAQLRRRRRVPLDRLRPPGVHLDAVALDADRRRTSPVDFELRGCPIDKHQLLEVLAAELQGRKPRIPDPQRLRGVQAARQRLRHGGARHAVPRSGHPGRLRRAVPGVRPGLLRLLRPAGHPQHRLDREPAAACTG